MSRDVDRVPRWRGHYGVRIDQDHLTITFFGVRGSTPCDGEDIARYGGNTSCVGVDVPGHPPIMFDLGTGARYYGMARSPEQPFDGVCLLTHLHWDHVQGLPFFGPILRPGATLDLHAPTQPDGAELGTIFREIWRPPAFPVGIDDLPVEITFHAHADDEFMIGDVRVLSRSIPHVGHTLGYRVEWEGRSVAYLSDHQQPGVGVFETTQGVRDLCEGADLLIHDAQYTREEFAVKSDWGHCTLDYAAWIARECGVRTLALFHHDPSHDDKTIDWLRDDLIARCDQGPRIVAAREGLTLDLGGRVG